jgi:hypothetical protein
MTFVCPRRLVVLALFIAPASCTEHAPDGVLVELAPEVVSSIDGTTTVRMLVVDDRTPLGDQPVRLTIAYTDRNGVDHAIEPIEGTTDVRGAFEAVVAGLDWEGTGTVTAEVLDGAGTPLAIDGDPVAGAATFAVLDRTPPRIEILPPTADLHVGPGLPLEVRVRVQDEIGVSEVWLEASGEVERLRSTVVASGATESDVDFRIDIPDGALAGPTITLHALAGDLSGNLAAAEPIVLTVDAAIAIATPPQLEGQLLVEGSASALEDPRAIALSPMDGMLYVADNTGVAPCNGACIRQIDPATGAIVATPVVVGLGTIEGVAFDAAGNELHYSDRQGRLGRLTWSAANSRYEAAAMCNATTDLPQDPYHLVHDATLGVLVAEANDRRVYREAACTGADPTSFTASAFEEPRGVALGAAGEIYVSDPADRSVAVVDRGDGAVLGFERDDLEEPWGIEWLAGGTSDYADSLMIADRGNRIVASSRGDGTRPTAYLRNAPVDVAIAAGTMYVLTQPSTGDRGRVFTVTGF